MPRLIDRIEPYLGLGVTTVATVFLGRIVFRLREWLFHRFRGALELDECLLLTRIHGFTVRREARGLRVDVPATWAGSGFSMRLRPRSSDFVVFTQVVFRREYAPLVKMVRSADAPVRTIVDIGANVGATTLYLRASFPAARIFCLEVDAGNFDALRRNVAEEADVVCQQAALWGKNEKLEVTDAFGDHREWARSVRPKNSLEQASSTVPGMTMMALLEQWALESVDILKIDVEGAEAFVFAPDADPTSWLPRVRFLAIEVHGAAVKEQIESLLEESGFSHFRTGETLFAQNLRPCRVAETAQLV